MGIKLVFSGTDGIFDRNDLFTWVGLIALMVFLGAEAYDKIMKSVPISDWAYITISTLVLGKGIINGLSAKEVVKPSKEESPN